MFPQFLWLPLLLLLLYKSMWYIFILSHCHVWLFVMPWSVARQASLSMGFSRQEYWSGLPFPPLAHLPNPGIEPTSPVSPALAGGFFTTEPPEKPCPTFTCNPSPTRNTLTCLLIYFHICTCANFRIVISWPGPCWVSYNLVMCGTSMCIYVSGGPFWNTWGR